MRKQKYNSMRKRSDIEKRQMNEPVPAVSASSLDKAAT